MSYIFIIMENEFQSLLNTFIKKIIKEKYKKENNYFLEIIKEISIKLISCLLGYYLYEYINTNVPDFKKNCGLLLIFIFIIFTLKQIKIKEFFKNKYEKLNPLKRNLWYIFHDDIFLNDYYNVKYDLNNPSKLNDPNYIKLTGHL